MSKTVGANLKAHIALEVSTLALLWKLTRTDSQVFGFTDLDQDITYDGTLYEASSGTLPSAATQSANLSVDNLDLTGFLSSQKISEADIQAGLYDGATMDIYLVNYKDLTQGHVVLAEGWIWGEVTIHENKFVVEVRSKAQKLAQKVVELYTPDCKADLGDSRCGIDVGYLYTENGTVTGVTDRRTFADSSLGSFANDWFNYGVVTWVTGDNAGRSMEVKDFVTSTGEITLFHKMVQDIQVGDTFTISAGCDRLKDTCIDKFDNIINFRGEPFVPGKDEVMKFGS